MNVDDLTCQAINLLKSTTLGTLVAESNQSRWLSRRWDDDVIAPYLLKYAQSRYVMYQVLVCLALHGKEWENCLTTSTTSSDLQIPIFHI